MEQDENKHILVKLVLWRGYEYVRKLGIDVCADKVTDWIEKDTIKFKSQSGRPVGNFMLDKVAMSSIYQMIQNGLLPQFDYLLSK